MNATIKDVAKKAGVSKATVSRVINNSKPVNDETRKKVIEAIKELGFKPNPIAKSLVSKKTKIVGVIIPDISNHFVAELVKGIESTCNEEGYNILLCNTFFSFDKEMEYLKMLKEKYVDGIVFMTAELKDEHIKFFKSYKIPFTFINRECKELDVISVDIDNEDASYRITKYFLQKGHRKIAMIRGPLLDKTSGYNRYMGYKRALEEYDVPIDQRLVKEVNFDADTSYIAVNHMLKAEVIPTAIFAASDLMAIGAIKAILDNGLKVPDDIEVAGFDDIPMASMYNPSITTVRQPIIDFGRVSAEILIKKITGEEVKNENVILPYEIIYRDSTK